jgi:hypothetical protein
MPLSSSSTPMCRQGRQAAIVFEGMTLPMAQRQRQLSCVHDSWTCMAADMSVRGLAGVQSSEQLVDGVCKNSQSKHLDLLQSDLTFAARTCKSEKCWRSCIKEHRPRAFLCHSSSRASTEHQILANHMFAGNLADKTLSHRFLRVGHRGAWARCALLQNATD